MLNKLLLKLSSLPSVLRIKFSPMLNRAFFRARGVKFGSNMTVFGSIKVINKGSITIGDNFMFVSGESISPISSNLQGSIYVEDGGVVSIGNNVGMTSTRMWIAKGLTIGDNVKVGANVLLMDTDTHQLNYLERRQGVGQIKSAPITIEDDVWIGAQCIILKGVTIGARSVIGAGSVVTKDIPSDCIAAGNPCKVIRSLASQTSYENETS